MADVVDRATRSRMMAAIRAKNTKAEIFVRKELHRSGFRFRLHASDLPGKPDLKLLRYNAVIFVHGCFWHGHDCSMFKWPSTRKRFWQQKIRGNQLHDTDVLEQLRSMGWRVATVWECSTKGKFRLEEDRIGKMLGKWLLSSKTQIEVRGDQGR